DSQRHPEREDQDGKPRQNETCSATHGPMHAVILIPGARAASGAPRFGPAAHTPRRRCSARAAARATPRPKKVPFWAGLAGVSASLACRHCVGAAALVAVLR